MKSYVFNLPVNKEVMFADHKGAYRKKIEKQQRDLIVKLPFLKPFLEPDEDILLITTGYSRVNTLDQILTAWLFIYLKRSLFVFTDKRIFHVPTTVRYGYRSSIAQILYSENKSISLKGSTLVVRCTLCGDQEKFAGIRGKEKKKIRQILQNVEFRRHHNPASERAHLCPHCTKELARGAHACPNCRLTFKRKSILRALVPGLGYFYVRQHFLGAVDIIVELIFIWVLTLCYLQLFRGATTVLPTLLLFGGLYLFHKVVAVCHANQFVEEYIPEVEGIKPLSTL